MAEVDLTIRDPTDINDHIKVDFHDVLAEPDGTHSLDCVWKMSFICFNCGKDCWYKFLTFLFGIFIALFWGCDFACISFEMVWCFTPALRVYAVCCGSLQKFFGTSVFCFLAPICETCGLFFSKIGVTHIGDRQK